MDKKNKKQESTTALQVISNETSAADKLQFEIEQKTKELQRTLEQLEIKKRLSANRVLFIEVLDKLTEATERISNEDSFDSEHYKLKFVSFGNYRDEEVFTIGNRNLITEFVAFIKIKVADKIRELEEELIS